MRHLWKGVIAFMLLLLPGTNVYAQERPSTFWWDGKTVQSSDLRQMDRAGFGKVYVGLNIDRHSTSYAPLFKDSPVEIVWVLGNARWLLDESHPRYLDFEPVLKYIEFHRERLPVNEVALDIEPYLLKEEWNAKGGETKLLKRYMAIISEFERRLSAIGVETNVIVPFWFDQRFVGKQSVTEQLFRQVDQVTIMAYRNTVKGNNGIAKLVEQEVKWAGRYKKKVGIIVETLPTKEGKHVSFHGKRQRDVMQALRQVDAVYPKQAIEQSVHDFSRYRQLKR